MTRLMSVALTEAAVRNRTKTVTRRLGWLAAQPGMPLTLCRKVMGRRAGDPLVRLAEVEIVSVRRERLDAITQVEVLAEGFPELDPAGFVAMLCAAYRCEPTVEVTRIEWRYLDPDTTDSLFDPVAVLVDAARERRLDDAEDSIRAYEDRHGLARGEVPRAEPGPATWGDWQVWHLTRPRRP